MTGAVDGELGAVGVPHIGEAHRGLNLECGLIDLPRIDDPRAEAARSAPSIDTVRLQAFYLKRVLEYLVIT